MKTHFLCAMAVMLGLGSAANAQGYNRDHRGQYDNDRRDGGGADSRDERVPQNYLGRRYIFNGWKERGLNKPARGQVWVHVCDAYILASARTGEVAQVHLSGRGRVDQNPDWRLRSAFSCKR